AAVVLPPSCSLPGLNDSKQLSKARREYFFDAICSCAQGWAVGAVDSCEIDRTNILRASLEAMRIAVTGLGFEPEILLIDGPFKIAHPLPQRAIKRGDSLSLSIAAASVVAKVTRDRIMCEFENSYPEFSFSVHKGYGTARHLEELRRHGPTPIHRLTFRGVGI
nr:ribonuclease HII [bacterium]